MISVLIPLYNQGQYLKECVDSVLSQTFQEFEIIIVDDCSTDDSWDVAKKLLWDYRDKNKIRVFHFHENRGVSSARNFAAHNAKGSHVVNLDADDKLEPIYLEKVWAEKDKADIVYTDSKRFGAYMMPHILPPFNANVLKKHNILNVTSLIRRDKFLELGGFDEDIENLEDWELYLRMSLAGCTFYKVPEQLFFYRKKLENSRYKKSKDIRPQIKEYIYKKLGL